MGKGLTEVGRGVRDAAAAGVENVRETVRNRIPADRQTRDNVVMVRVDKDSLDRMDDLIEAGVVGSRSEAANYLITEGIKARQNFFDVGGIQGGGYKAGQGGVAASNGRRRRAPRISSPPGRIPPLT